MDGYDGSGLGILAQRFDSEGIPQGGEFQVNTYSTGSQSSHAMDMHESGDSVVVWSSLDQDGSQHGIFGQRFDSQGSPQGGEFQVNTFTTGRQEFPAISMDGAGNFVVVWSDQQRDGSGAGIFGQRFDSLGNAEGGEFQVNTYTTGDQEYPSVAMNESGGFVALWHSDDGSGSGFLGGIFGRRFDSSGSPQGDEFQINIYTHGSQNTRAIGMGGSGTFVVAWTSFLQDGSGHGIFGRHLDPLGVPRGGEFQINTYTTDNQVGPALGLDGTGGFVAVWTEYLRAPGARDIYGQRFLGRGPELTDPLFGDTLDCSSPGISRPTLTWDDDGYDRFRVLIDSDPRFRMESRITSGDRPLVANSWTPSAKKWRRACKKARNADPNNPVLYLRVLGEDTDLPKRNPARKVMSDFVRVSVTL